MSFDLHCNGKNSFHSYLINMSEYRKLPDFNPDLLDIAMVKSYVSKVKQEYISYWQNTLQHSQKREFYRSFKTDHTSPSCCKVGSAVTDKVKTFTATGLG